MNQLLHRTKRLQTISRRYRSINPLRHVAPTLRISDRRFCSKSESVPNQNGTLATFFQGLNKDIEQRPMAVLAGLICVKGSMWFILQRVLVATGHFCGPELAVGYLIASWTGKFRQPLNVALAVFLGKIWPALRFVNIGKMFGATKQKKLSEQRMQELRDTLKHNHKLEEYEIRRIETRAEKGGFFSRFVMGPIETHGFPFYLTIRFTNTLTILGCGALVARGVDVMAIFQSWGMSQSVGDNFGALGGSTAINSLFVPVHLYGATKLAPILEQNGIIKSIQAQPREAENAFEKKVMQLEKLKGMGIERGARHKAAFGEKKEAEPTVKREKTEKVVEENERQSRRKKKKKA